ncbi:MAG TPA: hypothetical protein VGF30_03775 [Bacteroidia bacterium]
MQSNKNVQTQFANINLLNDEIFKSFLSVQTQYGLAQRGGTRLFGQSDKQTVRLVSDVNLLQSKEIAAIVFENFIGNN